MRRHWDTVLIFSLLGVIALGMVGMTDWALSRTREAQLRAARQADIQNALSALQSSAGRSGRAQFVLPAPPNPKPDFKLRLMPVTAH